LVSLSDHWEGQQTEIDGIYAQILQDASEVLALFSCPSSTKSLSRSFIFRLGTTQRDARGIDFPPFVQVDLQDISIDSQDFSSVGNQTWGSSCILAELIALSPSEYLPSAYRRSSVKVLELGAGTGLVSLTVAKVLESFPTLSGEVVATDFHPSVLGNLRENVRGNFPTESSILSVQPLDWSWFVKKNQPRVDYGRFDLIIGADIIYELDHAVWIKSCVETCLLKPEGEDLQDQPSFHMIIPLRRTHKKELGTVERVFDVVQWVHVCPASVNWTLGILIVDDMVRQAHSDDREDVAYKHYRIGWGVV
jgi:hypothetical protein